MTMRHGVSLAERTTLGLGGDAAHFVCAEDDEAVREGLAWATSRGLPVGILGGGSNLVVSDAGFPGLVIEMAQRGIEQARVGDEVHVTAAAGEDWDAFVAACVAADLAGVECLAGIPGRVGATPIQNVGAYGQDVSETVRSVRALERATGEVHTLEPDDCGFGYRDSAFKRDPDRYVVLGVTFGLRPGGAPALRYAELVRRMADEDATLARVREVVIALRRGKSMVYDPSDPNHRSAGSFFTNPILEARDAERVVARAVDRGVVGTPDEVPRWVQPDARVKLAAGWLIERSGMKKGTVRGGVGISTAHALALIHRGDGSTRQLLALADEVRAAVRAQFGVDLEMEPRHWG
ncbi:MAG: UDP-N-acetylmuramate dehydrogenase [Sandaracinaceae bacterium]